MQSSGDPRVWFRELEVSTPVDLSLAPRTSIVSKLPRRSVHELLLERGQHHPALLNDDAVSMLSTVAQRTPELAQMDGAFEDAAVSGSEYSPASLHTATMATTAMARVEAQARSRTTTEGSDSSTKESLAPTSPAIVLPVVEQFPPAPDFSPPRRSPMRRKPPAMTIESETLEMPASDRRVPSYLGPKLKMHSPAPWDDGENEDAGTKTPRSQSVRTGAGGLAALANGTSQGNLRGLGLTPDKPPPSPKQKSRPKHARHPSDSTIDTVSIKEGGRRRKNSAAASVASATTTSSDVPPAVPSLPNKSPRINASVAMIGAPVPQTGPSPTTAGPGFALIPLDVAREREKERLAAAAAARSDVPSAPVSPQAVQPPAIPPAVTSSVKVLKNKKSGLLKLFKKDTSPEPPLPPAPLPEMIIASAPAHQTTHRSSPPKVETKPQPTLSVTVSSPEMPLTPSKGRSGAVSAPAQQTHFLDAPQRMQRAGTSDGGPAPGLMLRPVSMLFSSMPADFLVTSEEIIDDGASSPASTSARSPASTTTRSFLDLTGSPSPTSPSSASFHSYGSTSTSRPSFESANQLPSRPSVDSASQLSAMSVPPLTPPHSTTMPSYPPIPTLAQSDSLQSLSDQDKVRQRLWDLENHVRTLEAELDRARSSNGRSPSPYSDDASSVLTCERCGCSCKKDSIISRPRPTATGPSALFSSGSQ